MYRRRAPVEQKIILLHFEKLIFNQPLLKKANPIDLPFFIEPVAISNFNRSAVVVWLSGTHIKPFQL